jgi:hypothetical protein
MLDVSQYGPHLAINRLLFASSIDPAGYKFAASEMIKKHTYDTKALESDLEWTRSASKKRQDAFDQGEAMLRASKGSTSKEQIRVRIVYFDPRSRIETWQCVTLMPGTIMEL